LLIIHVQTASLFITLNCIFDKPVPVKTAQNFRINLTMMLSLWKLHKTLELILS